MCFFQSYLENKKNSYQSRIAQTEESVKTAVLEEILGKLGKIVDELAGEIGRENLVKLEEKAIKPSLEKLLRVSDPFFKPLLPIRKR